jgi:hypothetical protein
MDQPFIIIPYRDRAEHLAQLIPALASYGFKPSQIIVVEQVQGKPFNRGKLLNIGAKLAFDRQATHIIAHDVDMIPMRGSGTYYMEGNAVHLATAASQFKYGLPYERYFGGVTAFSRKAFEAANGYSNEYWGWGAEDDDMLNRIEKAGFAMTRPSKPNKFESLPHRHGLAVDGAQETHRLNCARMTSGYDTSKEGLNTLEYLAVAWTVGRRLKVVVEI